MEDKTQSSVKATLPVILIAALVEGWGLYGLHHAIKGHHWPATNTAWLVALYAVVVFGPLTVQLLARYARNRLCWISVAAIAGVYFYFGWHQGMNRTPLTEEINRYGDHLAFALPLTLLWLLMLPFIQGRLSSGRWNVPYATLFGDAWRNMLALAEAAVFTGLLWLLLELWQTLFHMLKIDFFRDLFEEPVFVYPITAIAFGLALHLIGSIDRLTSVVLEQLLNVLKWLAVVTATLLTLFTIALAFTLPGFVSSGEQAIRADWLLWLVAVSVLLLNSAYRDGSAVRPYPRWIAAALRFTVPLIVVISLTASYALLVRIQHYGITVERVWGCIVAGTALLYSVGYSIAAFTRGAWMGRIAGVNILVAVALMLVIAMTLTPVLSPARLAANSQFEMALRQPFAYSEEGGFGRTPFSYLRFEAGTYGIERLKQLAAVQNHPQAQQIRSLAAAELAQTRSWHTADLPSPENLRKGLADIPIYPAGRTLDPALVDAVVAHQRAAGNGFANPPCTHDTSAGIFIDLNGDNVDEFILLRQYGGSAFEDRNGTWVFVGNVSGQKPAATWRQTQDELSKGNFTAVLPRWRTLSVGGRSYNLSEQN
jgi:hypothetical protein